MGERYESITKVGIGVSLGGLEALRKLTRNLDANNGFAYIVATQSAPHNTKIAEILKRSTRIPVAQAEDTVEIMKDHIYVIPPERGLSLSGNSLRIEPYTGQHPPPSSIDLLLESIAREAQGKAMGILLSGTGRNGSPGMRAIKRHGGVTFTQSQEPGQHSQTPQAEPTVDADFVLSPEEIAAELNRLGGKDTIPPMGHVDEGCTGNEGIIDLLEKEYQVDFTKYKASTFNRRTQRRMLLRGFADTEKYRRHLDSDPEELKELFYNLLINVTQFFRDEEAFEALKEAVYPMMFDSLRGSEEMRVWVAGCSTEEEAYSIAITITEYLDDKRLDTPVRIIGTDLNTESITIAAAGHYPQSIEENLSEDRLSKFFTKQQAGYHVSRRIREMCTFSQHDILADPPFANMDLISCRNLLIYLNPDTRAGIISTFHHALKPSGFLFLGKSETVGPRTRFKVESPKHKI